MNSKKRNSEGKCRNIQELDPEIIESIKNARTRIKKAIS